MKKIGLVIQGPLLSIGRTGNKLHETPGQIIKDGLVYYDCRPNIERLIKEFGHLFSRIVVSTWDNEVKEGDGWEGATLIHVPDPGGIKQKNHYKDNNKFRQFLSTLNGLIELEKEGVDYAVKIRTDIYLDLRGLLDSFLADLAEHPNHRAVYATVTNPATYLLHDLYFAAELRVLKDFCEAILGFDRFEFIASVHREMILKHAYMFYKAEIGVPDWAYFPVAPPAGVCRETREVFDFMFQNVYRALRPEIFRQTLWRGTHFGADHFEMIYGGQKARAYDLSSLIAIDWMRYYHFREQISEKKILPVDRFKAKIGRWGWDAWEAFKLVIRMIR